MGRKSSIRKLPPKLRDELNAMVRDGRLSIDAITEFVRSAGAPVSRSAVGRYVKNYEEQIADYRKIFLQELSGIFLSDSPTQLVGQHIALCQEVLQLFRQIFNDMYESLPTETQDTLMYTVLNVTTALLKGDRNNTLADSSATRFVVSELS